MNFQGRYQILEMLSDGEARTFKVRQNSSGRVMLLHQLWKERTPPNQPDLTSLVFGFLRLATADEMKVLVDMGQEGNSVFVVTEDLPICQDLRQWLQSTARAREAAEKASLRKPALSADARAIEESRKAPSQARRESSVSPETRSRYTVPNVIAGQRSSPPTVPPGPTTFAKADELEGHAGASLAGAQPTIEPPVAPVPPSATKDEPGEFTRIFFGKERPTPETAAPASSPSEKSTTPPASKTEKPTESRLPAGFEVVFESRKQPRGPAQSEVEKPLPSPPPPPTPEEKTPGDFTRIFYGLDETKAMPPSPVTAAEETRLTSAAHEEISQPQETGEFTKFFQSPQVKEKPSAAPFLDAEPNLQSTPAVQPTEQETAGEFTKLFHSGQPATRAAAAPISPSSPQPTLPASSSLRQQAPGEFTRLMQGYEPGRSVPAPPQLEQLGPAVPPASPKLDKAQPGEFTMIFQQPPRPATARPSVVASTSAEPSPTAAPQSPEPDEYMRMFELSRGGAGATPESSPQAPPPAAPPPGRAAPVVYAQPPIAPQPPSYQLPTPQLQQPTMPSPFVMPPQPVPQPQLQPLAVPVPVAPQAGTAKTGTRKFLVPLIVLGGLFLTAVVVILIFALRH